MLESRPFHAHSCVTSSEFRPSRSRRWIWSGSKWLSRVLFNLMCRWLIVIVITSKSSGLIARCPFEVLISLRVTPIFLKVTSPDPVSITVSSCCIKGRDRSKGSPPGASALWSSPSTPPIPMGNALTVSLAISPPTPLKDWCLRGRRLTKSKFAKLNLRKTLPSFHHAWFGRSLIPRWWTPVDQMEWQWSWSPSPIGRQDLDHLQSSKLQSHELESGQDGGCPGIKELGCIDGQSSHPGVGVALKLWIGLTSTFWWRQSGEACICRTGIEGTNMVWRHWLVLQGIYPSMSAKRSCLRAWRDVLKRVARIGCLGPHGVWSLGSGWRASWSSVANTGNSGRSTPGAM